MVKAKQSHRCFPFLKLPPEIRNKIYRHVAPHVVTRAERRARGYRRISRSREQDLIEICQPSLFLANKQLRTEGLPFFFSDNEFFFCLPYTNGDYSNQVLGGFWRWFKAIGSVGRSNLRRLFFNLRSKQPFQLYHAHVISNIHGRLSKDMITVTYFSENRRSKRTLWSIGHKIFKQSAHMAPVCTIRNKQIGYVTKPDTYDGFTELRFQKGRALFGEKSQGKKVWEMYQTEEEAGHTRAKDQ